MADESRPDAVMFHETMKRGGTSVARLTQIQKLLGPRLGGNQHTSLGPAHGGRVHICDLPGGWYFARLDPADEPRFPNGHDYARMPRYRWEDQPDGTKHGWLLSPQEIEEQAHAELPAETQRRQADLSAWKARQDANCAKLARWRELVPLAAKRTPAQEEELKGLYVEIFGDAPAQAPAF